MRHTWLGSDSAGPWIAALNAQLPAESASSPRGWTWPRMGLAGEHIFLETPVHKGSYSNTLMVQSLIHRLAGISLDKTLHSPRFYLNVLRAQTGLSMGERRSIGHWGPSSGMPIRYDQARCCTELAAKHKIWQHLEVGYTPVADFEVPRVSVSSNAEELRSQVAQRQSLRETPTPSAAVQHRETIVINHRTAMIHRSHTSEPSRTLCPYVRRTQTISSCIFAAALASSMEEQVLTTPSGTHQVRTKCQMMPVAAVAQSTARPIVRDPALSNFAENIRYAIQTCLTRVELGQ